MSDLRIGRRGLLAGVAAMAAAPGVTAAAALDAAQTIAAERARAAAENKRLLIAFFASWCVWCRPMDALLDEAEPAAIIRRRFRVLHLRTLEQRSLMRAQQLRGADEVYMQYATPLSGLPFLAIVDGAGATVATSTSPVDGENIGFPTAEAELDWLERMLSLGAPEMSAREHLEIRQACVRLGAQDLRTARR